MALNPGRMVEVPERQPYVRWTTTYYDFEEMRNMDLSPHKKASRLYEAKTGVGCNGVHAKVPLDLTKGTRGTFVEFLEKVDQSGKWPQQACTTMFFLIPVNVTSERPIALMPTLIRW